MLASMLGFAGMFLLMALRFPIAYAMGLAGFVGLGLMRGWNASLASVASTVHESGFHYALSVIPLFILMGNFLTRARVSDDLFRAANAFLGHRRGGLAMSTVAACGGFAAICGSSLATAATMAKVAYPSMVKRGYSPSLAMGSIAAGGTLGILIPPSVVMVLFGIITETSIGALFAAGILPGILGVLLYMSAVRLTLWSNPAAGPCGERVPWAERMMALRDVWLVVVLFTVVIGGIYAGIFTATEAAGVGATISLLVCYLRKALTARFLYEVVVESARTTAMIFSVLLGALIFANFVNFTGLPNDLTALVADNGLSPILVISGIAIIYVILGCALESISMILLTVPVFFPVVVHLGFDPVWFGVFVVMATEIGMITPPVGMNAFILRSLIPEVETGTIFRGLAPFVAVDIVRVAFLVLFPPLALFLPKLFFA